MIRFVLLLLLGVTACTGATAPEAVPANRAADIDALARNLSVQADAWRDDTDNQEAAATAAAQAAAPAATPAAMLQSDASPVANRR